MKTTLKKVLLGLFCLALTTGCMKANVEMEIKSDKSMNVSLISAVSDELLKMAEENGSDASNFSIINDEDIEKYKENGFLVEDYKKDGFTGAKITKNIKNIDDISHKETSNNNIMSIFEENSQKQYYFIVEAGFFKNKYKAVFNSKDLTSDIPDASEYSDDEVGMDSKELKQMMDSMESKFVLTLPKASKNNNADIVSEDGKTLTWNFIQDNPKETIEFEFELINRGSTYSVIAGVSLLVLLIVITLIKTSKPKKQTNPIVINNSSLESNNLGEVDQLGNNMDNKINENLSI